MSRTRKPPHSYLTDTERQVLDLLVRRAARTMSPVEGNRLIGLFEHHLADLQHARATAGGMRHDLTRLRQQIADLQTADSGADADA